MARAMTRTLLPLDTFARILGSHPLHFNQVVYSVESDDRGLTCNEPLLQYSWMRADKTGREELAEVIANAERLIAQWLGYQPAPGWVVSDVSFPRPANPTLFNIPAIDVRGYNQAIKSKQGYVISGGVEGKTLIGNAAVAYSDLDNDGFNETATVTIATSVLDTDEIALFYPNEAGDNAWEIRPLKSVAIAGGVATIVCSTQQLLAKALQEGYSEAASRAADAVTPGNFLTTVDVYRRYNNPATQAEFIWSPLATTCGCLVEGGCPSCTFSLQGGCILTRDARLGVVAAQPAEWDATTSEFTASTLSLSRAPDKVRLHMRAGYQADVSRPLNNMDPNLARIITYYAASLLERPLCSCKALEAQITYWRTDLAMTYSTQAGTKSFRLNNKALDNPLGTTRGAVNAWALIKHLMLGEGVDNA